MPLSGVNRPQNENTVSPVLKDKLVTTNHDALNVVLQQQVSFYKFLISALAFICKRYLEIML
jgi:hypothetical protein